MNKYESEVPVVRDNATKGIPDGSEAYDLE